MQNDYQDNTPAMWNNGQQTTSPANPHGFKADIFRQKGIEIQGATLQAQQIPNRQNDYTAVVQAGLQTNIGSYQGIGAASSIQESAIDIGAIMDKATQQALARAATFASLAQQTRQSLPSQGNMNPSQQVRIAPISQQPTPSQQKVYNHSKTKPASERQLAMIEDICRKRGLTMQNARELANIDPRKTLSSNDANLMIKALNSR